MITNWQEFRDKIDTFAPKDEDGMRPFMQLRFKTVDEIIEWVKYLPQASDLDNPKWDEYTKGYLDKLKNNDDVLWDTGLLMWIGALADGNYTAADEIKKRASYDTSKTRYILEKIDPSTLPEHHNLLYEIAEDTSGVRYSRFPGNVFARTP